MEKKKKIHQFETYMQGLVESIAVLNGNIENHNQHLKFTQLESSNTFINPDYKIKWNARMLNKGWDLSS